MKKLFILGKEDRPSLPAIVCSWLLVCIFIVVFFWISLHAIQTTFDFSFIADFHIRLLKGFGMTLLLSLASFIVSLFLGVISAAGQGSRLLPIRCLCTLYVTFIRGTPLIMQIYLFFYIIGTAWGIENRFLAGVLILSIFEGAYITEILRGSLLSIDAAQLEAARAVGFTHAQTIRWVILPQLIARTLPALTGQLASIIKDSSLLSMIAVIEITQTIREITATNFRLFEGYFFLGILYLCLTLPVTLASKVLERRFRYEN
ncbi:MAG: amino acid ABC transporter permease [Lachnospiraceae bacterium]|nr:amino acid ABC transporter permease [Lachnospiraceae bacterium]